MNDWLLWQLADSAFPAGGFAHSAGLEAAWQHGRVRDGAALADFLNANAIQLNRGVMRFVSIVWNEPNDFERIDRECDLFLNNHVANRASRAQGAAFLAAVTKTIGSDAVIEFAAKAREKKLFLHFSPVFGFVSRDFGMSHEEASSMFLFISMRAILSAAVRLGIVGPLESQKILANLKIPAAFEGEPVQTAPFLDLLQGTQDRLYSRLFQS